MEKNMKLKKLLGLGLALAMVVCFAVGCGGETQEETPQNNEEQQTSTIENQLLKEEEQKVLKTLAPLPEVGQGEKLAAVAFSMTNPFWITVSEGYEDAAQEYGVTLSLIHILLETTPFLQVKEIKKSYGHVEALRGVSLTANLGEVLAIVGDNGAGKSTLIQVLSGAISPDQGEIIIEGKTYSHLRPKIALKAGISTVYQDLALVNTLDAVSYTHLSSPIMPKILPDM